VDDQPIRFNPSATFDAEVAFRLAEREARAMNDWNNPTCDICHDAEAIRRFVVVGRETTSSPATAPEKVVEGHACERDAKLMIDAKLNRIQNSDEKQQRPSGQGASRDERSGRSVGLSSSTSLPVTASTGQNPNAS
jgi:hypothetical protein